MVSIEDVSAEPSASKERFLDAEAIEQAAATMTRPSAKAHLEALAKKLRKESSALKRVEESRAKMEKTSDEATSEVLSAKPPAPVSKAAAVAPSLPSAKYAPIDRFSFDAGGYNSSHVSLYVPLPSVGSISRDLVSCQFTPTSFDLIVKDLRGKNYRLFKDNLEKDIDPQASKFLVKADKVVIKLAKIKSEYGSYDFWTELTAKHKVKVGAGGKREKEDPQASIMEMMKDMYESGDDNMRKVIGETMMKQRKGELDNKDLGSLQDI